MTTTTLEPGTDLDRPETRNGGAPTPTPTSTPTPTPTSTPTPTRRGWAGKQMLFFDLLGPLVAYKAARMQGVGMVGALLISSVFPLIGVALKGRKEQKLDRFGLTVLVGTAAGGILSLIVNSPRPTLIFTSVLPTLIFAVGCLISLRRTPMLFEVSLAAIGGRESEKGAEFARKWDELAGFRRYFHNITLAWGAAYVLEAAVKVVIVMHSSTGHALASVSLLSTGIGVALGIWTAAYGNLLKRRTAQTTAR